MYNTSKKRKVVLTPNPLNNLIFDYKIDDGQRTTQNSTSISTKRVLGRSFRMPRQEKGRHFSRFLEPLQLIVSDAGTPLGAVLRTYTFSTSGFCAVHSWIISR
jgi:hypothetical protein